MHALKIWLISLPCPLLVLLGVIPAMVLEPSVANSAEFRAGAATVDITPENQPSIIAGGFLESQSSQVNDRLFVRSMVLDDGKTKLVLSVVDTCMMTQALIDDAKSQASEMCGVPVEQMMVCATHTHSAPAAMGCLGTRQDKTYAAMLPTKIAQSIVAAYHRLEPAKIGWGKVDDWEHTHNRRWIRKPEKAIIDPFGNATGRAHMHPGYLSPDVIGPSGPVDPVLSVLSLRTMEDKPLALFANYSQHYFGASAISADYYGVFCKSMASILNEPGDGNGPFVCAISQGTSGDLMWMDYGTRAKSISMSSYAEAVARYAEKALAGIEYRASVPIGIVEKRLQLKYRVPDNARLEWAKPIAAKIENELPKNISEVYAMEAMILHERQQTELKVQAIRIGDLTITTLPNEVYALTGLKLRGRSPFPSHFNIELANGAEGYIPPPEQHTLGGYTTWPARTAGLEVSAETKIVDTLVDAMEQVTGQPSRLMLDEHGPYANAVLAAKPIAYWRLNDEDGKSARNAVVAGGPAALREGFAWFLPGVGAGSGVGAGEHLRASAFSGSEQINRSVHLAGGSVVADTLKLSDDYSFAFWFWLGERSGAGERSGTLCSGPDGESVMTHQFDDHRVKIVAGTVSTSELLFADDWNFIVVNRIDDELHVHLNGSMEPTMVSPIATKGAKSVVEFGRDLQGKLDEIAIFDRSLKGDEVAQWWKLSGIATERARETAERERQANERHRRSRAPSFSPTYQKDIESLNPIVVYPMHAIPSSLQTDGNVSFDDKSFASFRTGRLKGTLDQLGDSYTAAMWFRSELPNEERPVTAYLFSRGPDDDPMAPGVHLGLGGNYRSDLTGRLIVFNGNARDQVVVGKTSIVPATWNHVVMVRDRKSIRLYLNGQSDPEINAELDETAPGTKSFFIGARCDHFAPLQGNVAFFSLFSHALTDDEATKLYVASGEPVGALTATVPQAHSEPLSPSESLAKVHVPAGFRVEMIASEPQVVDPVAFDWDSAGRLWVVEMSDYPLGMDGKGRPGGKVRVLEDVDRDGIYESSHLFADGLNFPNGIMTWRDGVLITAAPQLLFLRDTDGDGSMDKQEVLLEGFSQGNQQLRINHLRWGLDNWVYCANGGHHANHGLGTKVFSPRNGQSYEIGSRDFRFQPDTGALELESGPSQYGRNRDAWGHWFGTQNANPLWHYVLPDRYLARNPYVPTISAIQHVVPPNSPPVYPASQPEKRFHSFEQSGRFTSACSGMVYGDSELFSVGPPFHAFTCEPFHNLVQHNVLQEAGVSFASSRPIGEGPYDFFASEDRWCRPVMIRTGPDGALWIADMYRYMIEHPDWLPAEGKAELLPHYRLGDDRGRIYRITKEGVPRDNRLDFEKTDTDSLVVALNSTHEWRRDKAHQMLLWNRESSTVAAPSLKAMARSAQLPQTRVQSLYVLEGLGQLAVPDIVLALKDPSPRVREVALRLAESRSEPEIIESAVALATDADVKVCLQLALSIGQWNDTRAADALVVLAKRFADDPFVRSAIMSSALPHVKVLLNGLTEADPKTLAFFRDPLLRLAVGRGDQTVLAMLLANALKTNKDDRIAVLDDYLGALQSLQVDLYQMASADANGPVSRLIEGLNAELESARGEVEIGECSESRRLACAQLMTRVTHYRKVGAHSLASLLRPQIDLSLQSRAIVALTQSGIEEVPQLFATAWTELSPDLRIQVVDALLSREAWTEDLLNRLIKGEMSAGSLSLTQRSQLAQHPHSKIQQLAASVFDEVGKSTRKQILDQYREALVLNGAVNKGESVFRRACANCHRRGDIGHDVGPNLATVVTHAPEKLLTNIIDPNIDIQPGYQSYSCLLETGEILTGLLAAETANSVTIKQVNGASRSIARSEIERMQNSNVSFMPEGLETSITVSDMADLLAFLRQAIEPTQ